MAFVTGTPLLARSSIASRSARCTRGNRVARMALPNALNDRVFVRVDEAKNETAGGLVLTTKSDEKQKTGTVISVGEGRYSSDGALEPMPVSPGDHILWKDEFGVETVEVDGENLLALRVFSIVAKW